MGTSPVLLQDFRTANDFGGEIIPGAAKVSHDLVVLERRSADQECT
jgi:hypothetical protein